MMGTFKYILFGVFFLVMGLLPFIGYYFDYKANPKEFKKGILKVIPLLFFALLYILFLYHILNVGYLKIIFSIAILVILVFFFKMVTKK